VIEMDEEQRKRFKRAVDRKAAESEAASRATRDSASPAGASGVQGDQAGLQGAAESQDSFSEREKASRHGKVTADKWNQ
jgi:hypothetical protein